MIALLDYGIGNIQAFANIYKRLGIFAEPVSDPDRLGAAEKIILPGVGAFDWVMSRLQASGLRPALDEAVLDRKVPVLGVCVGMQIMASSSTEGDMAGLGWIDAKVVRVNAGNGNNPLQLPHMGWNDVTPTRTNTLFADLVDPRFYFLHSYMIEPANRADTIAISEYGEPFACAVQAGNVYGTQFHPEKSHDWGIGLLKNFAEI